MSQVKAGLEEPAHFLRSNLDYVFDHWPGNPTRPGGRGGGDRGECSLYLLESEKSRRVGCGPGWEGAVSSWGPGGGAPGRRW